MSDDQNTPPPYLGDFPDGAYWSAVPAVSSTERQEDYTVRGDSLRFMWDYTVTVPLWSEEGLLPEDPDWLRGALGLSEDMIRALTRWGQDMNDADGTVWTQRSEEEWQRTYRELDARARDLVESLRRELAPRFSIVYKPWSRTTPGSA